MALRIWRLVKAGRELGAWDGEGAFRFGGRWNSKGVRVVYASSSVSLALLEVLVHLDPGMELPALRVLPAELPAELVSDLPAEGRKTRVRGEDFSFPYSLHESRKIGDEWAEGGWGVGLRVPSVVVPNEVNYVLNPGHPDFHRIRFGRPMVFALDERLRALTV